MARDAVSFRCEQSATIAETACQQVSQGYGWINLGREVDTVPVFPRSSTYVIVMTIEGSSSDTAPSKYGPQ